MDSRFKSAAKTLLIFVLTLLVAAGVASAQTTAPPAKKSSLQTKHAPDSPSLPDLEPKAIELLKATSARLAAAHTLSFTAVEIFEQPWCRAAHAGRGFR